MTLTLKGLPNDKQRRFFMAQERHVAYGGARGGGKSWAMRRKFILLCMRYAGLNVLLLRRTLAELRENHALKLLEETGSFCRYVERDRCFNFPNGSRLKLGYCDNEKDVLQYQGQEYDVIGLEEATHFTEYQMNFITTCNRSTRKDFTPRMYYTANPGGVGHAWFKKLFIDKIYLPHQNADDYKFIPAKVYDNKILMKANPEYVKHLENLPDNLREAHLHGNWDVFSGQYFTEFDREKHIIKPFTIDKNWKKFRALDYGLDMTACLYMAVDSLGNVYVYKELYKPNLGLSFMAQAVLELQGDNNISYTVCSPDLWNRRQEQAISGITIMAENGLTGTIKAINSRIAGWRVVREYLASNRLKIFENCANLIRTLPQLQYDSISIEDVSDSPHELTHAPEALRYGLMSLPYFVPKEVSATKFLTPTEVEDRKNKSFDIRRNL